LTNKKNPSHFKVYINQQREGFQLMNEISALESKKKGMQDNLMSKLPDWTKMLSHLNASLKEYSKEVKQQTSNSWNWNQSLNTAMMLFNILMLALIYRAF